MSGRGTLLGSLPAVYHSWDALAHLLAAFEEVLFGPSTAPDGTMNLVGALRRAMATTGYTELKEFQRVEVVLHS